MDKKFGTSCLNSEAVDFKSLAFLVLTKLLPRLLKSLRLRHLEGVRVVGGVRGGDTASECESIQRQPPRLEDEAQRVAGKIVVVDQIEHSGPIHTYKATAVFLKHHIAASYFRGEVTAVLHHLHHWFRLRRHHP